MTDGSITAFDPAGSTYTAAVSINANAAIAGFWYDSQSNIHGFVRQPDETITTFDLARGNSTQPSGIDDQGRVAGFFFDANFVGHGFLRFPNGTVKTFDPIGSAFTRVESIDHVGGAITGEYADPQNFFFHGFILTP